MHGRPRGVGETQKKGHPKKKSLFPVHWLTIIMAIRAVVKTFFFSCVFFGKKD